MDSENGVFFCTNSSFNIIVVLTPSAVIILNAHFRGGRPLLKPYSCIMHRTEAIPITTFAADTSGFGCRRQRAVTAGEKQLCRRHDLHSPRTLLVTHLVHHADTLIPSLVVTLQDHFLHVSSGD